jgi:hypothetical protein
VFKLGERRRPAKSRAWDGMPLFLISAHYFIRTASAVPLSVPRLGFYFFQHRLGCYVLLDFSEIALNRSAHAQRPGNSGDERPQPSDLMLC